jgi:hypothetical protein
MNNLKITFELEGYQHRDDLNWIQNDMPRISSLNDDIVTLQ